MAKKKKASKGMPAIKIGGVSLADINFKQFLIQKGEKIALSIALIITTLLIALGLVVKCLALTSPDTTAAQLDAATAEAQEALAKADPPKQEGEVPPWLAKATDLQPTDYSSLDIGSEFFSKVAQDDKKWRLPEILQPNEFDAAVVRVGVPSYYFSSDLKTLYMRVRKDKSITVDTQPMVANLKTAATKKSFASGLPPGIAALLQQIKEARLKQQTIAQQAPAHPAAATSAEPQFDLKPFDLATGIKIEAEPAKVVHPYTMAIISGAFPYKEQLEKFRKALHYSSVTEMLTDRTKFPFVEFLGLNVQRRTLSLDGKELSGWQTLDIEAPYKSMRFLSVGVMPEDQEWMKHGVIVTQIPANRLLQRLPKPATVKPPEQRGAARAVEEESPYPKPNLPSLTAALEAMQKTDNDNVATSTAPPSRFDQGKFNPDDEGLSPDVRTQAPGETAPTPPPAPQTSGAGDQGDGEGGMMGGIRRGRMGGNRAPSNLQGGQEALLPDHCLFRFLDLTVEPGRAYEYRVQIRMANPAYGRKDLAVSEPITIPREITADGFTPVTTKVDGKDVPIQVRVDDDIQIYAVNEKPDPLLGAGAGSDSRTGTPDEAPVQIHRWLDTVPMKPNDPDSKEVTVGEWVITERNWVRRGDYIGRLRDSPVPWWDPALDDFILINQTPARVNQRVRKGIPIDFNSEAVLVDFEGSGKTEEQVGDKRIKLETPLPVEALVLNKDGHLVVHNQLTDADDPQRVKRVSAWKKKLVDIASKRKGTGQAGQGGQPGNKGGDGGGGNKGP